MNIDKTILVTGCAGFIGYHLCKKLIPTRCKVIGIDNLNNYYEKKLKLDRLKKLNDSIKNSKNNWYFFECDICDKENLNIIFSKFKPQIVIHLAAQAGVRYSITNPNAYVNSNLLGFTNLLESIRNNKVQNFLYASSSSVYGGNSKIPFSENDNVDHPVSLYAATKKANELIAHSYSHLYKIPSTGMRFFTVYGPWGRPDMAPMLFTKAILAKDTLQVFNKGDMQRDFTYIDDVVEIIIKLIEKPATPNLNFNSCNPDPKTSWAPHRIFNIGNSNPIQLMDFIKVLEKEIGVEANIEFKEMQAGDVKTTFADTAALENWIGIKPSTNIKNGIKEFIRWYRNYYLIYK